MHSSAPASSEDYVVPLLKTEPRPPGRPLADPCTFPDAGAFADDIDETNAVPTLTGSKRAREDERANGSNDLNRENASSARGASSPLRQLVTSTPSPSTPVTLYALLEASLPTLQFPHGALHKAARALASASAETAAPNEEQVLPPLSMQTVSSFFSSLASAEAHFTRLYSAPDKEERDTRRPVNYDISMQRIRSNMARDDLDRCFSCLTRGQHAHYAPGLQTVYTTLGARAPRWKSTPLNPDATTVAELVAVEQAEFKTKLLFAVCSCPRCRWYAPPTRFLADAGAPSASTTDQTSVGDEKGRSHAGDANEGAQGGFEGATCIDDELTFAHVDSSGEVGEKKAETDPPPSTQKDDEPSQSSNTASWRRQNGNQKNGGTGATAFAAVDLAALDAHEHLNYNYLNKKHVEPFAKRRRFHRVKSRVVAFLRRAASECDWLKRPQKDTETEVAGAGKTGDAAKTTKKPIEAIGRDGGGTSTQKSALSLREDHIIRLTADQFYGRYRSQHLPSAEAAPMVTTDTLMMESVHSSRTHVKSVRVVSEDAPAASADAATQKATATVRNAKRKDTLTETKVCESSTPSLGPGNLLGDEHLPRTLSYRQLDNALRLPDLIAPRTAADSDEQEQPGEKRESETDTTEENEQVLAAFSSRWQRVVDADGVLHAPQVIPISAATRAMSRTLFAAAAATAAGPPDAKNGLPGRIEMTMNSFLSVSGASLVFSKRALHSLLTAHAKSAGVHGKGGFRLPVRVRLAKAPQSTTGVEQEKGACPQQRDGLLLHIEVGDPFPRPFETRREVHTAAAKRLLRSALAASQPPSAVATPVAAPSSVAQRPRCCAEVTLSRTTNQAAATVDAGNDKNDAARADASAVSTSEEGGAVSGSDRSPSTTSLLPSSQLSFHVVASATRTQPVPLFDLVKLDYFHEKGLGSGPPQQSDEESQQHHTQESVGEECRRVTVGGDGGTSDSLGVQTSLFSHDDISREAPLLEAFSTAEALEISLLFHCYPNATVRVHHVNAYTGAILHVDHLSNGTWQPLLLRRLTAITATLNSTQLAQHRERMERKLIAHAERADACAKEAGEAVTAEAATTTARPTAQSNNRQPYRAAQTAANPLNAALFLPVKDPSTASALESMADVRYAWDCLFDVLANLVHQAVLGTAAQLCTREECRWPPETVNAGKETKNGRTASAKENEEEREVKMENQVFSFVLVKLSMKTNAPLRGKQQRGYHHQHQQPQNKVELCLQDVAKAYPDMSLRFDAAREASRGLFIEPTSGAVCEREYAGLREWPFSQRIPMTFRLSEV